MIVTELKTTGTDVAITNELYAEQIEARVAAQDAAMEPIIETTYLEG